VPTVLKSGSINLLEPSGPVQACTGIALGLQYIARLYQRSSSFILTEVITLGNKFQKHFVSVMNILLIYLFTSIKLEKGHKKLIGFSFKIVLPL